MTCCPQNLKAIVFDFDGTLAETNIDFAAMRRRIYELEQEWGLWEADMGENRYVLEVIEAAKAKLEDRSRAEEFGREAERVLVEVEMETVGSADPYPGVPEALLCRLFDPFFRIDDSRTRETGGTGLGLAIVQTCIQACGGTVRCRNRQPHERDLRAGAAGHGSGQ